MLSRRLREPASAVADASGNLTLTFGPVPSGRMWTGTVAILSAPSSAVWSVSVDGFGLGETTGAGPFGPVQGVGSETIVVTGSGFTAGEEYDGRLVGSDDEQGSQPWLFPATTNITSLGGVA